ncbi:hypothetical protein KJ616_02585 [Patescibacteria group bacterium]|nr:hypothetical protein [Patescibacteria group bacterium]
MEIINTLVGIIQYFVPFVIFVLGFVFVWAKWEKWRPQDTMLAKQYGVVAIAFLFLGVFAGKTYFAYPETLLIEKPIIEEKIIYSDEGVWKRMYFEQHQVLTDCRNEQNTQYFKSWSSAANYYEQTIGNDIIQTHEQNVYLSKDNTNLKSQIGELEFTIKKLQAGEQE